MMISAPVMAAKGRSVIYLATPNHWNEATISGEASTASMSLVCREGSTSTADNETG